MFELLGASEVLAEVFVRNDLGILELAIVLANDPLVKAHVEVGLDLGRVVQLLLVILEHRKRRHISGVLNELSLDRSLVCAQGRSQLDVAAPRLLVNPRASLPRQLRFLGRHGPPCRVQQALVCTCKVGVHVIWPEHSRVLPAVCDSRL